MNNYSDFILRKCPYCGSNENTLMFRLGAKEISDENWSYRLNCLSVLNLREEDMFDTVKCTHCLFIYAKLLPPPSFLESLYDEVIELNTTKAKLNYETDYVRRLNYLSSFVGFIKNQKDQHILDFGAGFGQTSKLLQTMGFSVVAYEPSALRRKQLASLSLNVVGTKKDVIANGPYTAIVCDNVLEHVANPRDEALFFKSIIKPYGILFISVPSYEPQDVARITNNPDMTLNPWEHLNYFDKKHLDSLFNNSGFEELIPLENDFVNIGLRVELKIMPRIKNILASLTRLLKYLLSGKPVGNVNNRFYISK